MKGHGQKRAREAGEVGPSTSSYGSIGAAVRVRILSDGKLSLLSIAATEKGEVPVLNDEAVVNSITHLGDQLMLKGEQATDELH